MGVIDADAHVIETERTWSFMLEQDQRFAPELWSRPRTESSIGASRSVSSPIPILVSTSPRIPRSYQCQLAARPHGLIGHRHPGSLSVAFFTAADARADVD